MGKGFKLKPQNNYRKKKDNKEEKKPISYISYQPEIKKKILPVYFDFMNSDEPPKVVFDMTPSLLW